MSESSHSQQSGQPDHEQDDHSAQGGHGEHGGLSKYLVVAVALVILTAFSYWTYTPLWPFGESLAIKRAWMMAVSCSKAMLVILFFMHLLWEANWKWVLTVPATCMSLFLCLALVPDVGWRIDNGFARYSRERLLYAADPLPPPADDTSESEHGHPDDAGPAAD